MKRNTFGFTLIELLVVIAIIAVISGIMFPVFASAKKRAKVEVGKQYLRQQFMTLEIYASDSDGVYPGYSDVAYNTQLHAPCSPLYDWKRPCWNIRSESVPNPVSDAPSPMIGGRGYIYAVKDWQEIDQIGKDAFLGWDRNKPYPLLADIFAANYRVNEFDGEIPKLDNCGAVAGGDSPDRGCYFPDTMWYAYTDGSLRVWRKKVDITQGQPHQLFDWVSVFTRQMDNDTRQGN